MTFLVECEINGKLPRDRRIVLDKVIIDMLDDDSIYEISLKIRKIDKIYKQKGGRITKIYA